MDRNVVVIGDVILDKTVHTKVRGTSPEDPSCLVANASHKTYNLGGAANVAYNAHTLGGTTTLVSAIGTNDRKIHWHVQEMIREAGFEWVAAVDQEGTICRKTRFMADRKMLLRVDNETKARITDKNWSVRSLCGRAMSVEEYMQRLTTRHLKPVVAMVDYGKGVFEDSVVLSRIVLATDGCLRLVDPGRDGRWQRFGIVGTNVYKANIAQTRRFCEQHITNWTGYDVSGPEGAVQLARHAVRCLGKADVHFAALVITLGPDGAVLVTPDGRAEHVPVAVQQLIDVCGAGDSFMAGMAVRLARTWSGGPTVSFDDLLSATKYGNAVASVAVQQPGVVAVRKEQISDDS